MLDLILHQIFAADLSTNEEEISSTFVDAKAILAENQATLLQENIDQIKKMGTLNIELCLLE